jgi:hypothetical protein
LYRVLSEGAEGRGEREDMTGDVKTFVDIYKRLLPANRQLVRMCAESVDLAQQNTWQSPLCLCDSKPGMKRQDLQGRLAL